MELSIERSVPMCPACIAAAAVTAAKVASLGGLTAFGVKKLLSSSRSEPSAPTFKTNGENRNEPTENSVPR
jgi:hypothetical protein